jgi:hypothetical protein
LVDDISEVQPAGRLLIANQARKLAFELLVCADRAERLTHSRATE